jgi:hypothetical protein
MTIKTCYEIHAFSYSSNLNLQFIGNNNKNLKCVPVINTTPQYLVLYSNVLPYLLFLDMITPACVLLVLFITLCLFCRKKLLVNKIVYCTCLL